jgi:hypothetical protein
LGRLVIRWPSPLGIVHLPTPQLYINRLGQYCVLYRRLRGIIRRRQYTERTSRIPVLTSGLPLITSLSSNSRPHRACFSGGIIIGRVSPPLSGELEILQPFNGVHPASSTMIPSTVGMAGNIHQHPCLVTALAAGGAEEAPPHPGTVAAPISVDPNC